VRGDDHTKRYLACVFVALLEAKDPSVKWTKFLQNAVSEKELRTNKFKWH
jgi:hypothetical protein